MLAVTAAAFTEPTGYQLSNVPRPVVTETTDVVIKVHAASVNPVDVKLASGAFKLALPERFPLKIGYDCAGIVTEVGSDVKSIRVGDEVWSRLPEVGKGSWAEYVKCSETYVSRKPGSLSFAEAASLPLAALTAMQALGKYKGSLAGKTVFVPAGLGGTGAFACQLAKNVFQAGKVITTVSTAKVDKIEQLLGAGVVDSIIDYTKEDPLRVIPRGSVDFMLDTMGQAMVYLSLMVPATSTIVSISTTPSGAQFQNASFLKRPDQPRVPLFARSYLDTIDLVRKVRAWRWGVNYTYMFLEADAKELDALKGYVEDGKIHPVIGSSTDLNNIEKVREVCQQVYEGKGGVGKAVFTVSSEFEPGD
ncbi:GroES-like protein [Myriangium duriaei CBS 260.36]|uniref:GroES-like protein n=1 Tax=Myriangium duriaei CBS 260.36 TaxID=1168546 RepID=A0A9P4ITQ6_9PEZI|nr:GroES-like protein [Myriangium duriaei CBS 260.36]